MTTVKENAYAKINLYLDVLGKRNDGYHDIKTVMHSVSLFDEVTVSVSPSRTLSVRMYIEGNHFLPTDGKNLAVKAAVLFLSKLGISAEVNIKLVKKIPVAAGLAGGSSDAAAVLRALNRIYQRPFTVKALVKLGAELGSDVPYCIVGKTALCLGRGESLEKISTDISLNLVIANAGEHISTPDAYCALDKKFSDFDGSVLSSSDEKYASFESSLKDGKLKADGMYNIFESVILPSCRGASAIKEELIACGADAAMMSGSGPSVFGVFKNPEEALYAQAKLRECGFFAQAVKSI